MNGWSGKSILVTGGTGFLGSHLVRRLVTEGASLTLGVRSGSDAWRIDDLTDNGQRIETDLADPTALEALVRSCAPDLAFHLAGDTSGRASADDPGAWKRSIDGNVNGLMNLMHALRQHAPRIGRIIRVGSMEEYGNGPAPFSETQREQAISPYAVGQAAATQTGHALALLWKLPLVTLRPSIVYGPAQDPGFFIPGLIKACIEGDDFEMTEGRQGCDFVYVDDVIEAMLRAAEIDGIDGEIFNVGGGGAIVIRDLAEQIVRQSGAGITLRIGAVPARRGESMQRMLDITKAGRVLRWRPSTGIKSGLEKTIEWFSDRYRPRS